MPTYLEGGSEGSLANDYKMQSEIQTNTNNWKYKRKIQKYMNTCIFVRLLGWVGWWCDARKLEMRFGHLYVPKFVWKQWWGKTWIVWEWFWSVFPWQRLPSRGRWYALKCVTPGVCAWSHRSSINISIKIKHVQQYISSSCNLYHHISYIIHHIIYHIIS